MLDLISILEMQVHLLISIAVSDHIVNVFRSSQSCLFIWPIIATFLLNRAISCCMRLRLLEEITNDPEVCVPVAW